MMNASAPAGTLKDCVEILAHKLSVTVKSVRYQSPGCGKRLPDGVTLTE